MQAIHNLPFFEYKTYDNEKNYHIHTLNAKKLSDDECHMFFPVSPSEEMMIATTLEFFFLHPTTKLNEKFNINPVVCGNIHLFWVSFPKEFKETCETVGKLFGLVMKNAPRVMVDSRGTILEMPAADNVVVFQGKRADFTKPEKLSNYNKVLNNVVWFGNTIYGGRPSTLL